MTRQTTGDRPTVPRRAFLRAGVGVAATANGVSIGGAGAVGSSGRESDDETHDLTLTTTVVGAGEYRYLPFEVPSDVRRIDVDLRKDRDDTNVGVGLFDARGPQYGSDGFRGVYGAERSEFFVTGTDASTSFVPGPMDAGTWTVVVPVFEAPAPTTVTVQVTLTFGTQRGVIRPGPGPGIVDPSAGWYRGDLHAHTIHSSDAWSSGSALTPAGWAETAADIGLDFVSMTDHNVGSQNRELREAMRSTDDDVLLVGGEEMTNWFHGHATVTGLDPGEWLDFRQRPRGVPLQDHESRVETFFREADRLGAYAAAAHPTLPLGNNQWEFWHDAAVEPDARPHGLEVWLGPWTPEDEAALELWDRLLRRGWRVTANGGSDTHGTDDPTFGLQPGTPTTVVYAEELSPDGIVEGLRQHRAFVTRSPDGPELYLTAAGPDGGEAMVGGTVTGGPADEATVRLRVKDGAGDRLFVLRDGEPIHVAPITENDQQVTVRQPLGAGGYVRAELRGAPSFDTDRPRTSRGDMAALTNPVFLEVG